MEAIDSFSGSARGCSESGFSYSRLASLLEICVLQRRVRSICARLGVGFALVPCAFTSQMCGRCGHIDKSNRRSQEIFSCSACGYTTNADFNAAENIKAFGSDNVYSTRLLEFDENSGHYAPKRLSTASVRRILEQISGERFVQSLRSGEYFR